MSPRRPRPGDLVTLHSFWKHANSTHNVLYFRRCRVISFGPKQGAFFDIDDERNVARRIYAESYPYVSRGTEPDLTIIARLIEETAAHLDEKIAWCETHENAYAPATVAEWRATSVALRAGGHTVADYADLVRHIRA